METLGSPRRRRSVGRQVDRSPACLECLLRGEKQAVTRLTDPRPQDSRFQGDGNGEGADRDAAHGLEAIRDPVQLQAMILGRDDTIAYQQGIIEELRAARESLAAELHEWQQRTITVSEELREAGRQIGHWMGRTDELGTALAEREATIAQMREDLIGNSLIHSIGRLRAMSGNHRIFHETRDGLAAEAAALEQECEAMRRELLRAPEPYQPSQFWEKFYEFNMRQLREAGLSNFKLTVNQNYQNYIPRSLNDPKIRPLLRWFRKRSSLRPLFAHIENPDGVAAEGYLTEPGTAIFNDDPGQLALYRTLVALGWEFSRAHDPLGLCERLEEPELGNPIRVSCGGRLLSQDLATSVAEVTDLMLPLREAVGERPVRVLEVGGGYGRFAHAVMSTQPVEKYIIVDIPPALHVSHWYLSRLFPERRMFAFRPFSTWEEVREEAEQADVIFLLAHQIELLPDGYVDAAVAISALHEMRKELANTYLRQMGRLSRHLVMSKHYWSYANPYDELEFNHRDYVLPEGFASASLKKDVLNPVFFIEILRRGR